MVDYVTGEGLYQITAQCRNTTGAYVPVTTLITMIGNNGRYRIGDNYGKQITDIQLVDGKLVPAFSAVPDLFTLIGRKYSCFTPKVCLQDSFHLKADTVPNHYTLSAQCTTHAGNHKSLKDNHKSRNKESHIKLIISGKEGIFQIKDDKEKPMTDIIAHGGQLKAAPMLKVLKANPNYDFVNTCRTIEIKGRAPEKYTLTASCKGNNDAYQDASVDLTITEQEGVFKVGSAAGLPCKSLNNEGGVLSCKV
jgi:hypothetical protein